eukprot:5656537-Pleurochrysis_carterae.AAC.1
MYHGAAPCRLVEGAPLGLPHDRLVDGHQRWRVRAARSLRSCARRAYCGQGVADEQDTSSSGQRVG